MDLTITLIRSGSTGPEEEGAYIGQMDTPLNLSGVQCVRRNSGKGRYPEVSRVYTSIQLRSRETAALIYPRKPAVVVSEMQAFDFGEFEGKRYHEIIEDPRFEEQISSGIALPCPGGEDPYYFSARCCVGFQKIMDELLREGIASAAIITHRTVMAVVLRRFLLPRYQFGYLPISHAGGCTLLYSHAHSAAVMQHIF